MVLLNFSFVPERLRQFLLRQNASASFYCATTVFRLLPRAAGKIELFYSTRLLYFGNSLVNHFIVFTGAHL